jgi:LmbE family N-acetylglucosaminyl deacetylase
MRIKTFVFLIAQCFFISLHAQQPQKLNSSEIYEAVQKLNFLGSAMYIAAHPDDENTRLISYLSNQVKARTAYLSMTRGDGGQNLIGPEIRELLGVIRTQELLGARSVDGGQQLFTRANDFGYSKSPEETLSIWNKDEVLSDVVLAIRRFKPDVIINRFDHRTAGTTHGHHTSSALLSMEAFDMVGDPTKYSKQLEKVATWQPKRLFFNTSWWFYGSEENFKKADKSKMLDFDIGVYYPLKGLSNNELASMASSKHLCQGFGRLTTRGSDEEYIELLKGDLPRDKTNIFDGINTTWSRVDGGKAIGTILNEVEQNFNFKKPETHIPQLLKAHQLIQQLKDGHWKTIKLEELKNVIAACAGLYLEASAEEAYSNPSGEIEINFEVLNRSSATISLKDISISPTDKLLATNTVLTENEKKTFKIITDIPEATDYTSPYWLLKKGSLGMYRVDDNALIGKPETPRFFNANFTLVFGRQELTFTKNVVYRYAKPDKGELYKPFEVLPEATANFTNKVNIFNKKPQQIPVVIKAGKHQLSGSIKIAHPKGWTVSPESMNFTIDQKGDQKTVLFTITPPKEQSEGLITPMLTVDGKVLSYELIEIAYEHIPFQSVLLPSEAKVVNLDIEKVGENIGYIVGAGDAIPESLEQIGYNVRLIDVETITDASLENYDAIVVGIRAYNIVSALKFKQKFLLNFVEKGGNLIVQYNTAWRSGIDVMSPFPLTVSRGRVTDENAEVRIIAKDHSLVNFPNKISAADFDGWVQERGLYFPGEWDAAYTPILSTNDVGEDPLNGSLLIAKYGKGNYIYTGLSFFRELPAGVPGAYRLFANMLSVGKENINKKPKG